MIFFDLYQQLGLSREFLLACVAAAVVIIIALVSHEVCHGLVALWNGDPTAKLSGRLSLNPAVHFDPFGLLLMLLVGFGYAKPVPVNPYNYRRRRLGDVTVSAAGVTANLLLAFFSALLAMLCMTWLFNAPYGTWGYYVSFLLTYIFRFGVSVNISFALFNILPIFPLDGFRFIEAFVGEDNKVLLWIRKNSMYIILAVFVLDWVTDIVPQLSAFSPFYWYFNFVGGKLQDLFYGFWGLIL